ncbi:unnamed protein product, partial [Rotaria sordida]
MASSNDNEQSPTSPEQLGEVPADLDTLILRNIDNQSAITVVGDTHVLSEPSLEATATSVVNTLKEFESNLSSVCNGINTSMRTNVVEVPMDGNNATGSAPPTPTGQPQTQISTTSNCDQRMQSISERHIMISYHHDSSHTIAETLRTQLRMIGYNVWMDRNDLHGSIHGGMAAAVENSFIVLFCINHEYFNSEFCEKEVKYTDKIHMNFIPCLLEAGYQPRSWLGVIIGDQLYIDFSPPNNFATAFEELIAEIKAIENRLQISHVDTSMLRPVEDTENTTVMSTLTTIPSASNQAQHDCLRCVIPKYPNNATLRWNSSGITISGIADVSGTNSTLLKRPYGLAFDSSNTLYIADYSNNRIQKLITGTLICTTVAGQSDGTSGNTPDKFDRPTGILFDSNDNMYITDRVNNRVQLWNKGASSGTTVAGTGGTSNISLYNPTTCVSGSTSDTMYILDTYNHRIISYPSGTVVAGGNLAGTSNTQLNYPVGFVYDSVSQSFLISNYGTNKIVRWLLSAYNWTHVAGNVNGNTGSDSSSFNQPLGITMDPMGNIYVADVTNHRIQFFLAGESNGTTIAGITGVSGNNSTLLYSPYWVILDNQLNLYVSDTFNHRVQ